LIRVLIVSPNPALRAGFRELLSDHLGIEVIGEAAEVNSINKFETDVILLASVSLARLSVEDINAAVLFLLSETDSLRNVHGLDEHVWGAISINATKDELVAAVTALGEGLWVVASGFGRSLMRISNKDDSLGGDTLIDPLTDREREVIQLTAQGLANKQIALFLNISEHTVKFHLSSIYAKLGVSSRTEAIRRGIRLGLISL